MTLAHRARWLSVLVLFAAPACANNPYPNPLPTFPVSGTVTIEGQGPLTKGTIYFTSEESRVTASGPIDSSGRFQLTTYTSRDGAPRGTYDVFFVGTTTGGYNAPLVRVIDEKYEDHSTTDIQLKVEEKSNVFEIKLQKPQPAN